jgi:hypothetical protein
MLRLPSNSANSLGMRKETDRHPFARPYVRPKRPFLRPDLLSPKQGGGSRSRMAAGHREASLRAIRSRITNGKRRRPDRSGAPRRRASHLESQRSIDDSAPGIISTAELQRFVSQRSPLECATVATRKTHAHSESLQPSSNVDSAIEPHAQSRTNS